MVDNDNGFKEKFRMGIDRNDNPIISIDGVTHYMNKIQFHAFTLSVIAINKKIIPEIDYEKIFNN